MKTLLLIEDNTANKISYYHIMLLLLSLPYNMFYSHLILISLMVHTIIHFDKKNNKPVFTLTNILLQSVFFLTLLGTIYSINRQQAYNEVGRQITILLMPIIFCFNPLNLKKYKHNFLIVFSLACVVAIIYLYLHVIITIRYYHLNVPVIFSSAFINHNFSKPFDIHATYYSMQIAMALVYLLSVLIKETILKRKLFYLFCCMVLAAGIIQLGSKSVFIALLLIINLAIPYFLLTSSKRIKYMLFTIPISVFIIVGIYETGNLKNRYVTELKKDLSKSTDDELRDPRLARWTLAVKIAAQSPVIGHGSGSEIGLLKERYFEHKFYRSYLSNLNAHNQFISFFIKYGIIGLLVFLLTISFGFKISLVNKDLLLFAFILVIITVSCSENILDRDKGILFYSLFFSLLVFSDRPDKITLSLPHQ